MLGEKNIYSVFAKYCTELSLDNCVINIKLFKEKDIKELNFQFAGNNYPTDVLTFNTKTKSANNTFESDIAMCWSIINKNATIYHNELFVEFWYIFTHALIHSLDLDHQTPSQQKKFIILQNLLLDTIGLKIDLDFFKRDTTMNLK